MVKIKARGPKITGDSQGFPCFAVDRSSHLITRVEGEQRDRAAARSQQSTVESVGTKALVEAVSAVPVDKLHPLRTEENRLAALRRSFKEQYLSVPERGRIR